MKITIEVESADEAKAYLSARDYFFALWDTYQLLRQAEKYGELDAEQVYDRFLEILGSYNIDIDEEVAGDLL